MITPTILLILLVTPWLVARLLRCRHTIRRRAGLAGITLVLIFTGMGHFVRTDTMMQLIPPQLPARELLVIASGIVEWLLAIAILLPKLRPIAGWTILLMLTSFTPLNIYAAIFELPVGGHAWGPAYLIVRLPLQGLIMFWVYRFAIDSSPSPVPDEPGHVSVQAPTLHP